MRFWKRAIAGVVVGMTVSLLSAVGWTEPSPDARALMAAHRQAAVEAKQKVVFHEEMEKKFLEGRGGSKIDMAGHCRYWANYYRALAVQEEKAAKELE